jgi:hypothetical protein
LGSIELRSHLGFADNLCALDAVPATSSQRLN